MSEQNINWITLEHASEISGASVAIIQDTMRKYKEKPEVLRSKSEYGVDYVDKNQILALFSASSNPDSKDKIPGTLFRWFDELRKTYENSLKNMQQTAEKNQTENKQDLKHQYETRIFELEENYQHQIANIKQAHQEQVKLLKRTIIKLEKQLEFHQQQNMRQQKSLEQLNTRYDAIILAMHHSTSGSLDKTELASLEQPALNPEPAENHIQAQDDIQLSQQTEPEERRPEETLAETDQDERLQSNSLPPEPEQSAQIDIHRYHAQPEIQWQIDALLDSAFQAREQKEFKIAFELFEQAALLGSNKAMGALARCYFTSEGTKQDIQLAIGWLRLAEAYQFEPAAQKLVKIQQEYPDEFAHSIKLVHSFNEQIHQHLEEMNGYTEA